MKKFRKKPVVIEAIQWTGENVAEVAEFLGLSVRPFRIDTVNGTVEISTLEGTMTASKYDYIIKGVQGEFYPCKPDIFEQTYETVSADEFITEVNITELLKVAEASEKQYDQVVKQNRDLQTQLNAYKKELTDIKTEIENDCEACKEEHGEDCNCDECLLGAIYEGCKGVLCQASGVQTVSKS